MNDRSDEIALHVQAEDSGLLEGYLTDFKKGLVPMGVVVPHEALDMHEVLTLEQVRYQLLPAGQVQLVAQRAANLTGEGP